MNKIYYLLFLLIGLNFSVVAGLYYFDFLIIFYLIYNHKKLIIRKNTKFYVGLIFCLITFPSFISIIYQYISFDVLEQYSVYIPYNSILLMVYILFLNNTITKIHLNYNILISLFIIPIIVAILMFHIPIFNSFFSNIYNIDQYYMFNRAAGIWGKDVNQLGYYSSIFMIFSSFLMVKKKINYLFGIMLLLISVYAVLISGMRTGLAAIIFIILFLSIFYKFPVFKVKYLILIFLISFILLYVLSINFIQEEILKSIIERFDFQLFLDQLTGASGDGHIGNMYAKWYNIFAQESSVLKVLFSFDPSWKFPDSLVIFYFANNGLVGVFLLLIFILFSIKIVGNQKRNYMRFFILLFSTITAFKGLYPFNNVSMFIFTFISLLEIHETKILNKCE